MRRDPKAALTAKKREDDMQFAGMNAWAIAAAAIASFVFGAIWYGTLAKSWMTAAGKTEADIKSAGSPILLYAMTLAALVVMAWVLAGIIGHLGPGQVTLRNGIISGAFAWVGFVATALVVNHGFQGAPRRLTLIDGGHWLGVLLIQGAVIGAMGV
jgi:hypothetical protein